MPNVFRIYDELYGYIRLTSSEKLVVDTQVFQRLRRVKQLSLASLVYPGAEHTRFSHSIGVAFVASAIGERFRRLGLLSDDDVDVLRLAALLHDIGHLPFSHALEYAYHVRLGREGRKLHERLTVEVVRRSAEIREALWLAGVDPAEVASILEGKHRNKLLVTILSGDLDADRLDYLPRDALHTGVAYGLIDRERLVDTVTVDGSGRLALQSKGLHALENFYVARLHMYRAVYHHKTVTAFTLLLARVFEALSDSDPEVAELSTLEGLVKAIESGDFAFLDDAWLMSKIAQLARKGKGRGAELARSFMFRRGPKLVYERVSSKREGSVLDEVVDKVKKCVPEDSIYVYREEVKVKDVDNPLTLVGENGSEVPVTDPDASPLIASLPPSIVIERVYVDPKYAARARDCVSRGRLRL